MNKVLISICAILTVIFNSCKPLYLPNTANVPMLTERGEFNANVNTSINGINAQLAYSPREHVGFMFNTAFNSNKNISHFFIEGGAGYYAQTNSATIFDVYGGFGGGSTTASETNFGSTTKSTGNYFRFFIQPNVGSKTEHFDICFSPRFSIVNMNENDFNNTPNLNNPPNLLLNQYLL